MLSGVQHVPLESFTDRAIQWPLHSVSKHLHHISFCTYICLGQWLCVCVEYLGWFSEHLVQTDELQTGQWLYELREWFQFDSMASDQSEVNQAAPSGLIWGRTVAELTKLKAWLMTVSEEHCTCDPVVRVMQVRTVVDEQVFDVSKHLVHHLYANVCDNARVLNDVGQTVLHQFWVTHLACMENTHRKFSHMHKIPPEKIQKGFNHGTTSV